MSTPLAWKNLTHDRKRLAIAIIGVGFAALLIFMQLGFLNALLESTVQVLRRLNGELILISATRYALPANDRFESHRLRQAASVPGVQAVFPMYMETVAGVLRAEDSRGYPIRVLAFHENDPAFNQQTLASIAVDLLRPATALVDEASRPKYRLPGNAELVRDHPVELSGKRVRLVGKFLLGVDFATDGNLLMTSDNFASFFPQRAGGRDPLDIVDLGIVKLEPGADPAKVRAALSSILPDDVKAFTKGELVRREMIFWRTSAPVGYIFLVGVYMGFIVGVIICYQIIYTDIANHMREFATLKAMGYGTRYFLRLVCTQAFFLSVMGFVPAALLSYMCYALLAEITGLTMRMTWTLAATVFLVTLFMCVISGLLALRKLIAMDPAELF